MSETVKVKKENLLNAYENGSQDFKDGLVRLFPGHIIPISIHVRIANGEAISFEDILADQKNTPEEFAESIENDTEDEAAWKRAKLISKAINITPLQNNENWYVPVFTKSGSEFSLTNYGYWTTTSLVGARLYGFRERAMSDYAGKTFAHIYQPLA